VTRILAIDPGPEQSAWLFLWDAEPVPGAFGILPNQELLGWLRDGAWIGSDGSVHVPSVVVIETIEPRYGLQMGWSTLDTARWIGRFQEAAAPIPVVLPRRSEILRSLGVVTTPRKGEKRVSADSGVRSALIDRFGGEPAIRKGGPLFGISKDVWSALAIAVTHAELEAAA
jgi:hypothetical protein